MLLIITNKEDLTADFLITRLLEKGKSYFRLNSEDLVDSTIYFAANRPGIVERHIEIDQKQLNFQDVSCVWYRRKLSPIPSIHILDEQRYFVIGEILHLIEGLLWNPAVLWVNPMDAVNIAELKVYQLRLAQELGFIIPQSIISNSPKELREFASKHSHVICKPIYHGLFRNANKAFAVHTRRILETELLDDLQLSACPSFLQEEIPKGEDIRVTFIGEEVFPVEIFSHGAMPLDWRVPGSPIAYRVCDLPNGVESLCRSMLRRLRLHFGAFDFVRSSSGKWVFMEINPTGEWAWLENALDLPMRDAFIKLFGL